MKMCVDGPFTCYYTVWGVLLNTSLTNNYLNTASSQTRKKLI